VFPLGSLDLAQADASSGGGERARVGGGRGDGCGGGGGEERGAVGRRGGRENGALAPSQQSWEEETLESAQGSSGSGVAAEGGRGAVTKSKPARLLMARVEAEKEGREEQEEEEEEEVVVVEEEEELAEVEEGKGGNEKVGSGEGVRRRLTGVDGVIPAPVCPDREQGRGIERWGLKDLNRQLRAERLQESKEQSGDAPRASAHLIHERRASPAYTAGTTHEGKGSKAHDDRGQKPQEGGRGAGAMLQCAADRVLGGGGGGDGGGGGGGGVGSPGGGGEHRGGYRQAGAQIPGAGVASMRFGSVRAVTMPLRSRIRRYVYTHSTPAHSIHPYSAQSHLAQTHQDSAVGGSGAGRVPQELVPQELVPRPRAGAADLQSGAPDVSSRFPRSPERWNTRDALSPPPASSPLSPLRSPPLDFSPREGSLRAGAAADEKAGGAAEGEQCFSPERQGNDSSGPARTGATASRRARLCATEKGDVEQGGGEHGDILLSAAPVSYFSAGGEGGSGGGGEGGSGGGFGKGPAAAEAPTHVLNASFILR